MARPKRTVLEYRSYELPADFPILALAGDQWHISPVPSPRLHIHNCLEIGLCHTSGGTLLLEGQKVEFSAGCVTCIARNVPHTTWSAPNAPSLWSYLFLDPERLLSPAPRLQLSQLDASRSFLSECSLVLRPEQAPWAQPLATGILRDMQEKAPGWENCVRGLCLALLVRLLRVYAEAPQTEARDKYIHAIFPALDFIQTHYMTSFPQDSLAAACHMSPTHFRRLFREQMGTSPLAFLHQTRVLKSCDLLRASENSIADIAERVGYASLSSYNRHFLQFMGCAPSAWRRSAGSEARPSLLTYTGWTEAENMEEE